MDTQQGMSMDYRSCPDTAKILQNLVLHVLLKGLGRELRG
jgi:hypothetical protein